MDISISRRFPQKPPTPRLQGPSWPGPLRIDGSSDISPASARSVLRGWWGYPEKRTVNQLTDQGVPLADEYITGKYQLLRDATSSPGPTKPTPPLFTDRDSPWPD
ncbi:hypothetical protein N7467_003887 [Penicillium canescens]|nr:hypothetical protein N7467_003887 [Penicillium canescens]